MGVRRALRARVEIGVATAAAPARTLALRQMSAPYRWRCRRATGCLRKYGAGQNSIRLTTQVRIAYDTPTVDLLPLIAEQLSLWQRDPWAGHIHPGDLGWHSSVGPEQMAKDLRVWTLEGVPIAMGMLDGSEVLRMAIDPSLANDKNVADRLAHNLNEPDSGLFTGGEAIIEARGAHALSAALKAAGWVDDEPWTPMALDLTGALDMTRLDRSGIRVEQACPAAADVWTSIHWSSFKGTPYDDEARSRFVQRWTRLMTGPFADRAHSLVAYDPDGTPVAVTTVWTAGDEGPGWWSRWASTATITARATASRSPWRGLARSSRTARRRRPLSQRTRTRLRWRPTRPLGSSRSER